MHRNARASAFPPLVETPPLPPLCIVKRENINMHELSQHQKPEVTTFRIGGKATLSGALEGEIMVHGGQTRSQLLVKVITDYIEEPL